MNVRVAQYILKAEWCAAQAAATTSQPMRNSFRDLEGQLRDLANQVTKAELIKDEIREPFLPLVPSPRSPRV